MRNDPEHICTKFRGLTLDECVEICASVRGCELERATPNYLVLVLSRHFRMNFMSTQGKVAEDSRVSRSNFMHVFLGLFQDASSFLLLRYSVRRSAGLYTGTRRNPVENSDILKSCQEYNLSSSRITHGTAKFEGDLSSSWQVEGNRHEASLVFRACH